MHRHVLPCESDRAADGDGRQPVAEGFGPLTLLGPAYACVWLLAIF